MRCPLKSNVHKSLMKFFWDCCKRFRELNQQSSVGMSSLVKQQWLGLILLCYVANSTFTPIGWQRSAQGEEAELWNPAYQSIQSEPRKGNIQNPEQKRVSFICFPDKKGRVGKTIRYLKILSCKLVLNDRKREEFKDDVDCIVSFRRKISRNDNRLHVGYLK